MNKDTTLLISTYNWTEALDLIFRSVLQQSVMPGEIVIADDGSTSETKMLINAYRQKIPVPIIHVWHEDNGFTKTIILNKAIAKASGDYIIQIDGDIILHKHFVKDHINFRKKNVFLYGTRVTITKTKSETLFVTKKTTFNLFTDGLKKKMRMLYIPLLYKLFKEEQRLSTKLRGANMSYWRQDAISINGYNEEFQGWGFEDYDFAERLLFNNVLPKRIKFAAICFHLYHKKLGVVNLEKGTALQNERIKYKMKSCKKGIDQYLD